MHLCLDLFLTMARIGAFTFGGGYAMIPLIESICVERKGWITHEEMMNITVIAESTPGPVAINCSTYVGYKQAGVKGAIAATFGMVLPSFIVIYLISMFLDHFLEITWVASAFRGIRIAVGLLILNAALNMIRKMSKRPFPIALMIASALAMLAIDVLALNFSSVALMLIAGALSFAVFCITQRGKGGAGK